VRDSTAVVYSNADKASLTELRELICLGVNATARRLESDELAAVFICGSGHPRAMFAHLISGAASRRIPACVLASLDDVELGVLLGMRTVTAFGVLRSAASAPPSLKILLDTMRQSCVVSAKAPSLPIYTDDLEHLVGSGVKKVDATVVASTPAAVSETADAVTATTAPATNTQGGIVDASQAPIFAKPLSARAKRKLEAASAAAAAAATTEDDSPLEVVVAASKRQRAQPRLPAERLLLPTVISRQPPKRTVATSNAKHSLIYVTYSSLTTFNSCDTSVSATPCARLRTCGAPGSAACDRCCSYCALTDDIVCSMRH
jgi:hypothetical protein